jgi:uncharacterized protein
MLTRRAVLPLCVFVCLAVAAEPAAAALQNFETSSLVIVGAHGRHRFTVELAQTPEQLEQGLMFRPSLAPDAGMLFDFKMPTVATMWMRNTLIPLDMLFVDANGTIVAIRARAVPGSDAIISAGVPVRAVIELNGGTAERLGITPGDRVLHPIFGTGP